MGICANTNTHGQIAAYSPRGIIQQKRLLLFLVTAKSNTFICYYLVCSRHWLKSAQIIPEKNGQCVAIQVGTDKSDSLRDRSRPDVVDSIVSRRSSFLLPHPFHNCCCLFLFFCTSFRFLQYARCSLLNFCLLQHSTRQRAFHIHKTLSQTNVRTHIHTQEKPLPDSIVCGFSWCHSVVFPHHKLTQGILLAVRIPDQGEADPFSPRTKLDRGQLSLSHFSIRYSYFLVHTVE